MLRVFTAQYRYAGPDRLDITVKGRHDLGKQFAPTWDMVWGYKQGRLSQEEYTARYRFLLNSVEKPRWEELLARRRVVLVCFCQAGAFCHRLLLARYMVDRGWGEYVGELR